MRLHRVQSIPNSERGSALLAALCFAMVFAISLSSYIALCYTSLSTSTRNVVNDHCLELAESGIEQALYASNNTGSQADALTGWTTLVGTIDTTVSTSMTMTAAGLSPTSGLPTPLNYGNGATGLVNVTITYLNGQPSAIQSIVSQGVITLPGGTVSSKQTAISRTLTWTGSTISGTAAAPLFVNALAATSGRVRFSSAGVLDSFNSNPSASSLAAGRTYQICWVGNTNWTGIGASGNTQGVMFNASQAGTGTGTAYAIYDPVYNKGFSAVVESSDVATTSATVRLNNATVDGFATGYDYSSPTTDNWLSYTGSAQLKGSQTPSTTSIDSARILTTPTPYQPIFPENLPNASGNLPAVYTSGGNVLNITCSIGNSASTVPVIYYANGINLGSGQTVTITGPVVLIIYAPGPGAAITIAGTGGIQLTTPQASLTIFSNGGNVALGGYGITNTNTFPLPKRCALLNTTQSGYSVTMSQTQPFYGTVYFPYETVNVSMAASYPIYGSIIGSTVNVTTSPTIHYDLALRTPDSTLNDAAFEYVSAPTSTAGTLLASVP